MRDLVWMASTRDDLSAAPISVRKTMGGALRTAQRGGPSEEPRSMRGDLRAVVEVSEDDRSGTYRLMYTVVIEGFVYVLDFFEKKAKSGIGTPKADLDRVRIRLKKVRERHAPRQ